MCMSYMDPFSRSTEAPCKKCTSSLLFLVVVNHNVPMHELKDTFERKPRTLNMDKTSAAVSPDASSSPKP